VTRTMECAGEVERCGRPPAGEKDVHKILCIIAEAAA
jgi:hypothetical protein